jgi:hypothetical protein
VRACPGLPGRFVRTALLALLVALIGVALGSIANAYWGGAGSGQGSGSTTTAAAVVVSTGAPSPTLYPGGHAAVVLTVSNPNGFPVHIAFLTLDTSRGTGGFTADAGHSGCAVSALRFPTQMNHGVGWTLPAKAGAVDGSLSITLTDALSMDVGAADSCQGATFTVALSAGP